MEWHKVFGLGLRHITLTTLIWDRFTGDSLIDRIDYDINAGWPVGEVSRGHSLRLHSPDLDNSLPEASVLITYVSTVPPSLTSELANKI